MLHDDPHHGGIAALVIVLFSKCAAASSPRIPSNLVICVLMVYFVDRLVVLFDEVSDIGTLADVVLLVLASCGAQIFFI